MPAEQVGAAFGCLLQHPKVLLHLSENEVEHLAMTRVRDAGDTRRPSFDERVLIRRVPIDDRLRGFPRRLSTDMIERICGGPTQRGNRVAEPLEVNFLTAKDLLKAVVRIVGSDRLGIRLPLLEERKGVPVELVEEREELGGVHEVCFALQLMQTRVHGIAFNLASAIGSPQSRHTP